MKTLKYQFIILFFTSLIFFGLFFGFQNARAGVEENKCCSIQEEEAGIISSVGCRLEGEKKCDPTRVQFNINDITIGYRSEKSIPCSGRDVEGKFYGEAFQCWFIPEVQNIVEVLAELGAAKCDQYKTTNECNTGKAKDYCFWSYRLSECVSRHGAGTCPYLSEIECREESRVCVWKDGVCNTPLQAELEAIYGGARDTGILPPCTAFGTCSDVNQILEVVVNFTREVFKYVGALAFVFFIYGGGLMVFSFGNAEKFRKGQTVLIAAVIGLLIAFSAYFMVGFLLDLLGGVG